jgi:hypothetical protein
VFTKYDQFKQNVEMDLEDESDHESDDGDPAWLGTVEKRFDEHYLCHLGAGARFVQLESAFRV